LILIRTEGFLHLTQLLFATNEKVRCYMRGLT
jgi:hypothetical protein